jgi:hypothetical protein
MPTVGASLTKSMKLRPLIGSLATDCSSISEVCSGRVVSMTGAPPATVMRSPLATPSEKSMRSTRPSESTTSSRTPRAKPLISTAIA